ncbi:MAG: hypothetical protein DRQ89_08565 [Epsilonproteobacteria bacterium]|nr:MAG: hypothetical protein DRQ89_08565 [Campylobacterota bacterium]
MLFKISFRNLFRQKRRTFLTVFMMILGFTLMSFSVALSEGGYGIIIQSFAKAKTGHIQIYKENFIDVPNLYKTINNTKDLIDKLKQHKSVVGVAPRILSGGLLSFKETSVGASITAVDINKEKEVSTLEDRIDQGRWFKSAGSFEILVGKNIASILEVKLGSKIAIIAQGADGSISNDYFTVSAILKESAFDNFQIYMDLKSASEFLALEGRAHKLVIFLDNYEKSKMIAEVFKNDVPKKVTVAPWFEVEKEFYKGMQADKKGNVILYIILGIVVAIGVLNTILMSFLERKREFGILKAIGTGPKNIFWQIIIESMLLCFFGIFGGLISSYFINWHFSINGIKFDKIEFGGIVFEELLTTLDPMAFIIPTAIILFSTLLVALYPAIMAARVTPIEAMRAN